MKNIIKILLLGLVFVFIMSCEDKDTVRIPQNLQTGPNARFQLDSKFSNLNFADIANAKIKYDFFSKSTDIDSVVLSVIYNPVTGSKPSDTVKVVKYTKSDISSKNGIIRNQEYTSDALAKLVGLKGFADLKGGDNFRFVNKTYMTDGRIYPKATVAGNTNVTPNIANSAATTSWTAGWTSYVACPISASFDNEYNSSKDTCYPGNFTGPVKLKGLGGPIYELSGFTLYTRFKNRKIKIVLVCGKIIIPSQSPGLGCGGNPLLMTTASKGAGTYTENDSKTLTLKIDYPSSCGGKAFDCTIILTKK